MSKQVKAHLLDRSVADLARITLARQRIGRHFRQQVGEIIILLWHFGDTAGWVGTHRYDEPDLD